MVESKIRSEIHVKSNLVAVFAFIIVAACMGCSSRVVQSEQRSIERLSGISLGTPETVIKERFGMPSQVMENYGPLNLRLLDYSKMNSVPDLQFAFDPKTGALVEKAMWIYPGSTLYSRDNFNSQYQAVSRTVYSPCHMRSDGDAIEANESLGFYLSFEKDHPAYISWSTPEITRLRIDLLYEKCPNRQPARK